MLFSFRLMMKKQFFGTRDVWTSAKGEQEEVTVEETPAPLLLSPHLYHVHCYCFFLLPPLSQSSYVFVSAFAGDSTKWREICC